MVAPPSLLTADYGARQVARRVVNRLERGGDARTGKETYRILRNSGNSSEVTAQTERFSNLRCTEQ